MARTDFQGSIFVPGDITLSGNIVPGISRSSIVQQDLQEYGVSFTEMRVHDALSSLLPAAATADDLGLAGSTTYGTAYPYLLSSNAGGTTVTQYARWQFQLPPEYVAGQSCRVSIHCGAGTAVSDGTMTVDMSAYLSDDEGAVSGSDLVTTSATDCNSLTMSTKSFVITGTTLTPGATLDCRLVAAVTDSATATVYFKAGRVKMLLDIQG